MTAHLSTVTYVSAYFGSSLVFNNYLYCDWLFSYNSLFNLTQICTRHSVC